MSQSTSQRSMETLPDVFIVESDQEVFPMECFEDVIQAWKNEIQLATTDHSIIEPREVILDHSLKEKLKDRGSFAPESRSQTAENFSLRFESTKPKA